MSVPLPLVPVVVGGAGLLSGVGGAGLWLKGGYDLRRANARIRRAGERYDEQRSALEKHAEATNESLKFLGANQQRVIDTVVERMADFLRRHKKQVKDLEKLLVDGLESTPGSVSLEAGLGLDAVAWARGVIGSVATGIGVKTSVTTAVIKFGTASTGATISSLHGAAATSATYAFAGGGSLASGGGGVVLGTVVLNAIAIGSALLLSGFVVKGQGEKARTRAAENEATIEMAIAEMELTHAAFDAIIGRAAELEGLLDELAARAASALDLLESEPFDTERHGDRIHRTLTLTVAARDVATTPIVDDCGALNEDTATFIIKYRKLLKESARD